MQSFTVLFFSLGHVVFGEKSSGSRKRRSSNNDDTVLFTFDNAITPVITEIVNHKQFYSTFDIVQIAGTGFSTKPFENSVRFGDHLCTVIESTASAIKCRMKSIEVVDMYVKHEISLSVTGIGKGRVNISSYEARVVLFKPSVVSMTPDTGSFMGGASVMLSGSGLDRLSLEVRIGQQVCQVIETTRVYNSLYCVMPNLVNSNSQSGNVSVSLTFVDTVDQDQWGAPVPIATGLSYTYSSLTTLNVTSVLPSSIDQPGKVLTVNIQSYEGGDVTQLSIKLKYESSDLEYICLIINLSGSEVNEMRMKCEMFIQQR